MKMARNVFPNFIYPHPLFVLKTRGGVLENQVLLGWVLKNLEGVREDFGRLRVDLLVVCVE